MECKCCKREFKSLKYNVIFAEEQKFNLCENCFSFIGWMIEYHLCRYPKVANVMHRYEKPL